ncbi:right-handed parallel beta-helix repeat-containing protein [Alkalimonas collagenimarina]|uniref:Right-handed parallel beta-helix repeat-containing protein n=1 Tax=Alkalimonas collagenimarina TaxID=400390 RepID=A0ABT9GZ93_9GAMM|nr:right-handed parallel beta-helix repeat-containing protein [Alkalimonas collagenimarina]MDP4536377.1 right-handed parallel beta-helix repeat-containing protein [Alkalimonas collagenimarina]
MMKKLFCVWVCFCSFLLQADIWVPDRAAGPDLPAWVSFDYAEGRFLYVDAAAEASDADGSVDKPFSTITAALNQAKPHDEIIIAAGDYHERLRIRQPHITLRADALHQARVISPNDDRSVYFALRIDAGAHHTRVIGLDISGGYFYTVSLESTWSQNNPERKGVSHVLLSQNRFHASGRDVMKLKPMVEHVVIERNEIFNSGQRDSSNAEGIDNVNAHFMTVQDNYIHSIATTGVYAKGGARNSVIQRNLIRDVGSAGILVGFDTSPDFFDLAENPEMYEAINTMVDNNIIDGTGNSGIGVYAAKNSLIRHNTVLNSAQTYHAALFFGNVLHGRRADGKRPPAIDVEVVGNIFHTKGNNPVLNIRHMRDRQVGPLSSLTGMPQMRMNGYAVASGRVNFSDGRPDSRLHQRSTLPDWQRHSGSDEGSKVGELALGVNYRSTINGEPFMVETSGVAYDYFMNERQSRTSAGAVVNQ